MQGHFRCTFCRALIPWAISPAELGVSEAETAVAGHVYPYEKCSCGYGKFVTAEGSDGAATASAAPTPLGIGTREKIQHARYAHLPIDTVHPNPRQPRKFFEADALRALADSIARVGLLEDILVRPDGDGYEIVLGERRWRATLLAGLPAIAAKVVELGDDESRLISITENVNREDLTAVEEAFSFKAYVDQGHQLTEIGAAFGGMEQRVADRLKTLNSHYYVRFQEERIERLQQIVETLRERVRAAANGRYEAKVVPAADIESTLAAGYDVAAVLPDGRVAVRRRVETS